MRIIEILELFVKEIEKSNPYNLVLKGGTALSLYYFDYHRESEDLDFDADIRRGKEIGGIESYFINILTRLRKEGIIENYRIGKKGFASTNRYHMKIEFITYKTFVSKLDIDFVELPKNLRKVGELGLYTPERIFISKIATFISRQELKDLYDIRFLLGKVNPSAFRKNVVELLERFIKTLQKEELEREFRISLRNIDLRFKHNTERLLERTKKEARILINRIKRA